MIFEFIFGVDLPLLMVYLLSFRLDFSPCFFPGLFLALQGVFCIHNISGCTFFLPSGWTALRVGSRVSVWFGALIPPRV
jgi:hypothetical protein